MWPALLGAAVSGLVGYIANRFSTKQQNAYNAPVAQMQRYRDAGLNPNLIYGQGTPGNQPAPVPVPEVDLSPVHHQMAAYALTRAKEETHQYIKHANANALHEAQVKQQEAARRSYDLRLQDYEVGNKMRLSDYSVEAADVDLLHRLQSLSLAKKEALLKDQDLDIRKAILSDKNWANMLHDLGLDRHDSPWARAALTVGHKVYDANFAKPSLHFNAGPPHRK